MRNLNQPRASTTPFTASRRPYPLYNNISYAESGANSLYSGIQVQVNKRFSHGLLWQSAWTWAYALSDVDDTGNAELNTPIENSYDRRRDHANLYSVPEHQWLNQVLYDLPGRGLILGGWQLNALLNMSTGNYLNPVFASGDPSNTNTIGGRPDVASPLVYPETVTSWFDRRSYAPPPANSGRFGNAPRNSVLGPGYAIFNLGMMKNFRFEHLGTVQLGGSFQNLLNHVNLGQPNMTIDNANGGVTTSTHIFPPAGSARTGQLSLRWMF
jgi:hypothetical protein